MPVKVRCTSCEKVLTVPDTARGKAVKCPGCQERIAVPEADGGAEKSKSAGKPDSEKAKKKPAAKSSKPVDSEDTITTLDLRRIEDTNARICSKCGYDMQYEDEEESECPKCGYDIESGGLGKKAQKRAMKGPDPADFYPGLAKDAWKFVLKNQMLAWRTSLYTLISLVISLFCVFMYLWVSPWPPRVFLVMCFFVAFMVIPGWLWLLEIEIIQMTLERKDKFKRYNFDFFLSSAMGMMVCGWAVAIAAPMMVLPLGIGYFLVANSGYPSWTYAICAGIGLIPALWMLPICLSHMAMPITLPGWLIWKVVPTWTKTVAPLSMWMMWLFLTTLPITGGLAAIGAVWHEDIQVVYTNMESNAKLARDKVAAENAPKGKNAAAAPTPESLGEPVEVPLSNLLIPTIILLSLTIPSGFIAMFNMRINGLFTYYNKSRLGLIDKKKEYKYVSKVKIDEAGEVIIDTSGKDVQSGIVAVLLGMLISGGAIYKIMTTTPSGDGAHAAGMVAGMWTGCGFGIVVFCVGIYYIVKGKSGGGEQG